VARVSTLLGSLFYLVWAALHIQAGLAVIGLGDKIAAGMPQGRIYQDAWTLLVAAVVVVVVSGLTMWRSSAAGYWVNLAVATVTDVGFIVFILVPGYMPLWPGLQGPLSWILGMLFATVGIVLRGRRTTRVGADRVPTRAEAPAPVREK
jgi:hypothetical protein